MEKYPDLGGIAITCIDLEGAKARLAEYAASGTPHQIITANVDYIHQAWLNDQLRDVITTSDLIVADGMPLVWLSRLTDQPLPQRLTGMQLLDACCELAVQNKYSLFLLGGQPGLPERAAIFLVLKYPGLRIAGTYAPPIGEFTAEEEASMVRMIREAKPTVLFVGLGCPKQDFFIRRTMHRTNVPISIGVGGIYNFITGRKRRAPAWMQKSGLEWLFRFWQEPSRLWKRYFVYDLPTVIRLCLLLLSRQRQYSGTLDVYARDNPAPRAGGDSGQEAGEAGMEAIDSGSVLMPH